MQARLWLISFLVAGCAARMHPSATRLRDQVAGCYEIRTGPWRSDSLLNRPHGVATLPGRLQLHSSLLRGWDELQSDSLPLFAVTSPAQPGYAGTPFVYWQQDSVGSVTFHVGQPIAFGGVALSLQPRGSSLLGTIASFTDAIPPDGVAYVERPIVLDRINCGSD